MTTWTRLGIGVVVLAASALSATAQRSRWDPPPDLAGRCYCTAGGVECLFGSAGGCQVTCEEDACRCEGAWCFLGFPRASRCTCDYGPIGVSGPAM